METVDVVVIGGGVSGLTAAYELRKRKRSVAVLERDARAGGVIQTERAGDFVIDAGPDAILVQKSAGVALCNELGLGDRLFPTKTPRTAFVVRDGRLHPLPGSSVLGFPTRFRPLLQSTLFSAGAKARIAAEVLVPRRRAEGDESIAQFVRRRFGSEAVTYIAEPRVSVRAVVPRSPAAHRRVCRAFARGAAGE